MRAERLSLVAVLALALLLPASLANAGSIYLADAAADSPADSNYANDGQYWHSPDFTTTSGSLSIPLDFGSGPVTGRKFQFDRSNGRLTFTNDSGVPTGEFVAPLAVPGGYNSDYQNGFWTFGELNPAYLLSGFPTGPFVYDPSTTLKAYRFFWPQQCPVSKGVCSFDDLLGFQAVFIAIDAENFVLQFNYNNPTSPAGGIGSFLLGSNAAVYNGPFTNTGPNYCFHNGVGSLCGSIAAIPEPPTPALMIAGILMVAGFALRRRVQTMTIALVR